MVKIKDLLCLEEHNSATPIQSQVNLGVESAQKLLQEATLFMEKFRPVFQEFLGRIDIIVKKPAIQHIFSVISCKTIPHPIYIELFPNKFEPRNLEVGWKNMRRKLWLRFPENLKDGYREIRYNQILKCQTIGSYIAVCRSIYPEIESLLRDELLLSDMNWRQQWLACETAKERRIFQSQQFNKLVKNELPGFELANSESSLEEVGVFTALFIEYLENTFDSFDPAGTDKNSYKGLRHLHAHGWSKEASFVDGLNSLLIFDLALQTVSQIKENRKNGN